MGHGSYDYVTTCVRNDRSIDTGLPFAITAEHIPLAQGRVSAVKYVFVTLYDSSENEMFIVKLGNNWIAEFSNGTELTIGRDYIIDSNQNWYFTVTEDANDIKFVGNYYQNGHRLSFMVKYRWPSLRIYMSLCFKYQCCGLCGSWDDSKSNDLLVYNESSSNYYYLASNWDNYHLFGDSWCNPDISALQTSGGDSYCGDTNLTIVNEHDAACLTIAQEYCATVWSDYCETDCLLTNGFNYTQF